MKSNLANCIPEAWKNNYKQLLHRPSNVVKQEKTRKQVNAFCYKPFVRLRLAQNTHYFPFSLQTLYC